MTKGEAVLLVLAIGCGSSSPYAGLDRQANTTLNSLKSVVAPILGNGTSSDDDIDRACGAGVARLEPLRDVDFHDRTLAVRAHAPMVQEVVISLLDDSSVMCPASSDPVTAAQCAKWCNDLWHTLARRVDAVGAAAKADGVRLVSLTGGT